MTVMKWIEKERTFPEKCPELSSYFEDVLDADQIYCYHVTDLPGFRQIVADRLGDAFTPRERLEIAKLAFRNKPEKKEKAAPRDREIKDYIYQL